jgi:putative DNA primase/helicase
MMTLQEIARVMGGDVSAGGVNAPGPGHTPSDRSLRIFLDNGPDSVRVHSFAGDDPIECKDYVRGKLGLPAWQPSRPGSNGRSYTNGHKPNGHAAPVKMAVPLDRDTGLPCRTLPDADGQPRFYPGDGPPQWSDEVRRHIYRRDGVPVRVKTKHEPKRFINWYAVADNGTRGWQPRQPAGYVDVPYIGAIDPFDPEMSGGEIFWPEGEKDCDTLGKINLPALCFGGTNDLPEDATFLAGRHVVIPADNDDPGRKCADAKAALATAAGAASVRIVHFRELPPGEDVSDFLTKHGGTGAALLQRIEAAPMWAPTAPVPDVANTPRALAMVRASDVELKPIDWLWPGKFALGKLALIAGEPGLGKSQLTARLAATVTTGGTWPSDNLHCSQGSVVLFSAEDDASDTIVPRLKAAGADLEQIQIVSAVHGGDGKAPGRRAFNLQTDLDLLEKAMRELGNVRLVVIDPITSYLGRGVDSHKNADVRSILEPVGELAARYGAAFVGITHFSKGGEASALNKFIGSIAFIAAARAAFVVTTDPDSDVPSRRLFLPVKNNLAPKGDGLSFHIEQAMIEGGICASRIEWGDDVVTKTADEILAAASEDSSSSQRSEAAEFLRVCLADGPKATKAIEAEAKDAGIAWRTVIRAKKDLGIDASPRTVQREGGLPPLNRWWWSLPTLPSVPTEGHVGHVLDVAHMGGLGTHGDGWRRVGDDWLAEGGEQ